MLADLIFEAKQHFGMAYPNKPIHTIVLDAGPMLKNDPPISTLLAKAESLLTVPAVISEIRDPTARDRIETIWMPFLKIASPGGQSIKAVTDFARRTGDLVVLSKTDIEILAMTYEVEEERNGPSNIRTTPGQQLENQKPSMNRGNISDVSRPTELDDRGSHQGLSTSDRLESRNQIGQGVELPKIDIDSNGLSDATAPLQISEPLLDSTGPPRHPTPAKASGPISPPREDSDSEDWITPSNIQNHQAKDQNATSPVSAAKPLEVGCITSDFAMQNVLLSMNLGLLNASLQRIRNIRTYILRCHACFENTKDMTKQFCPRCGKPTLTRVSCSTNSRGEFKMHLKKNMQWNHRGDRYSIPKPVSGNARGKFAQAKGGGKGGWGHNLILAEDQKEYVRATSGQGRRKDHDLMDEDFLPSIVTGNRQRAGGRPKIGAGKNVNSKKR